MINPRSYALRLSLCAHIRLSTPKARFRQVICVVYCYGGRNLLRSLRLHCNLDCDLLYSPT